MTRSLYEEVHEEYRATVRTFLDREVVPSYEQWEKKGEVDLTVFQRAASAGIYGLEIPEEFGGPGVRDIRFRMIVNEEVARARTTTFGISLANQDDMVLVYLLDLATPEQLEKWLPRLASGDAIGAVAMTEPGTGSDLRAITTSARRDGDDWVLTGEKTFITNGGVAGLVIVAARTENGHSLFVVERGVPGFTVGQPLQKVGLRSQDTRELSFAEVRLPADAMLGAEGSGFRQLKKHLARERLSTTLWAVADARAVYDLTVRHCFDRSAFGQRIGDFQNTRFLLAELATELDVAEAFIDGLARRFNDGTLSGVDAAKGKWWCTELQTRVADRCLQLHGGYGYMLEYPVARAFIDSRVQTIYGGTTEIMKEIIGGDIARAHSAGGEER